MWQFYSDNIIRLTLFSGCIYVYVNVWVRTTTFRCVHCWTSASPHRPHSENDTSIHNRFCTKPKNGRANVQTDGRPDGQRDELTAVNLSKSMFIHLTVCCGFVVVVFFSFHSCSPFIGFMTVYNERQKNKKNNTYKTYVLPHNKNNKQTNMCVCTIGLSNIKILNIYLLLRHSSVLGELGDCTKAQDEYERTNESAVVVCIFSSRQDLVRELWTCMRIYIHHKDSLYLYRTSFILWLNHVVCQLRCLVVWGKHDFWRILNW